MSSRRRERDRNARSAPSRDARRGGSAEPTSTSQALMKFGAQDAKVLSIFEVFGSYYVDVFFNHLHATARKTTANGEAVTDKYRAHAQAYLIGVKNDKHLYHETVQGVHRYFAAHGYSTWTFAELVDRVVGCFVPAEYFRQMKTVDKDEILSSVVCDLVGHLATYSTSTDLLRRVIDLHDAEAPTTIRMMQDACVSAQIQKRDEIHNKFISRLGQTREGVSAEMFEKLKRALRQLAEEKAEAVQRAERAEDKIEELRDRLAGEAEVGRKLRRAVELLTAERQGRAVQAGAGGVPNPDRLAERPLALPSAAEDRLAERRSDDRPGEHREHHERGEHRPEDRLAEARPGAAPARHGVSADFFKVPPALGSGGAQAAAPRRSARAAARAGQRSRHESRRGGGARKPESGSEGASEDEGSASGASGSDDDDGLAGIEWTGR